MKNFPLKYPLKLKPVTKSIIWGGKKIPDLFGIGEKDSTVAEAWLLTCREDGMSIIQNGEYMGVPLNEYLGLSEISEFPLLIKLIDATDRLSVQVHPDDAYAAAHGIPKGKTEMWYVLDALPGATLVLGLKDGVTADAVADSSVSGDCEEYLNYVNVKKGDCFFIPAGLVHAIGKGILIAEIQQNSNTTYRLYDYNRKDKNGNPRELHIEEARATIKTSFDFSDVTVNKQTASFENGVSITILADCQYFSAVKYSLSNNGIAPLVPQKKDSQFIHIMCVEGKGELYYNGTSYPLTMGDSYYVPTDKKTQIKADEIMEIISSE